MPLPPGVLRTHTHTNVARVCTCRRKRACSTHNTEKKRRLAREEEEERRRRKRRRTAWKTVVEQERMKARGERRWSRRVDGGGEEDEEVVEGCEKTGVAEDDAAAAAAGGGNGDGEWRWWWQDALACRRLRACTCTGPRIRAREYRDSSLKIQMEYRAFEEREVPRGEVRGGGLRDPEGKDGGRRRTRRIAPRHRGMREIFQKSNIDQSCQSYPL